MEALVNDLRQVFASEFQAQIANVRFQVHQHIDPVYMFGHSAVSIQHGSLQYNLEIEVVQSAHRYIAGEYTAFDVMTTIRHGVLEPMMKDAAALQGIRTDLSQFTQGFSTTLQIVVFDMEKFEKNVKNFSYARYSAQFDELMEKTLKD